jgi:hypothetical protein
LTSLKLIASFAAVTLAVAGCGGSDEKNGEKGGDEPEQAQEEALGKIPAADREAFIELATAIGALRARAAPVVVGASPRLGPAGTVLAARSQVAALQPSDPKLVRIRARLLPLLARFARAPRSGPAARTAAKRAIAAADRIEPGLRAYSRGQPAIGGLIPD